MQGAEQRGFKSLASEAQRAESRHGVLGEGTVTPASNCVCGSTVSSPSGVWGRALAVERFFCILKSSGSLFCYVLKIKQLQKSLSLAARGRPETT